MVSEELKYKRERMGMLVHPSRLKVLKALYPDKELWLSQLSEATGIKRPDIAFHVTEMQMYAVVDGDFRVVEQATETKKGKAAKFYKLTEFGRKYWGLLTSEPLLSVLESK